MAKLTRQNYYNSLQRKIVDKYIEEYAKDYSANNLYTSSTQILMELIQGSILPYLNEDEIMLFFEDMNKSYNTFLQLNHNKKEDAWIKAYDELRHLFAMYLLDFFKKDNCFLEYTTDEYIEYLTLEKDKNRVRNKI